MTTCRIRSLSGWRQYVPYRKLLPLIYKVTSLNGYLLLSPNGNPLEHPLPNHFLLVNLSSVMANGFSVAAPNIFNYYKDSLGDERDTCVSQIIMKRCVRNYNDYYNYSIHYIYYSYNDNDNNNNNYNNNYYY